MKRYEKMSREEIIDAFDRTIIGCHACHLHNPENIKTCSAPGALYCAEVVGKWLKEELKTEPRCYKCKTIKDFSGAMFDWAEEDHVKYPSLADYMMEEVE